MSTRSLTDQKPSLGIEAKRLRLDLRLTQRELAKIAGVPLGDVELLEDGLPLHVDVKLKILRELWVRNIER